jgi:hypothetical protein
MAKRVVKKDAMLIDESVVKDNLIKTVVSETYSDIGIYRWMNRNKEWLKWIFGLGIPATTVWAMIDNSWPLFGFGMAFIILAWAGAIDHFWIGFRLRLAIRRLSKVGIDISLETLLDTCKDVLPK